MKKDQIKFNIFFVLMILLLLSFQTRDVFADTTVGGNITADTTWTKANSPYIVTSTVQVLQGVKLTVEPGVTIEFYSGVQMNIGGILKAIGTETAEITFTGSNWAGIHFIGSNSGATFDINGNYIDGSIIKYSIIQNVGGYSAIDMVKSAPFITDNSIINNGGYSIYVGYPNAKIVNNTISYNDSGIHIEGDAGKSAVIINNNITNNLTHGLYLWGSSMVVENNRITNNGYFGLVIGGVYGGATVSYNSISNNGKGGLLLTGCGNKVTKNTIIGNGKDGIENHGSLLQFQYNNLYNNIGYDLSNLSQNSTFNACPVDVLATNNWWGTSDSSLISSKIYDYYDDISFLKVIYQPYASAEFDITIITGDITGTIKNSISGEPIVGASVSGSFGSVTTDGLGKYLISNLSPAVYTLTITASKYISSTINNVTVSPGAQTVLDISLVPKTTGTLTGLVLNSEGLTPISTVTVKVTKGTDSFTKITDVNGNFSFNDLTAGDYVVELISTSYWSNQHSAKVNIDETTQLTITGIPQAVAGEIRNGWFTQDQLNQAVADANAAKDLVIAQKDQTIATLNTAIISKDQTITTLNASVASKDETIAAMYTKTQLDKAVADANAAKDLIIATMFTKTQLDKAVADANAAKDLVIAEKDQTIAAMFTKTQLDKAVADEKLKYDINGDGKIGMAEVIYILQTMTNVR